MIVAVLGILNGSLCLPYYEQQIKKQSTWHAGYDHSLMLNIMQEVKDQHRVRGRVQTTASLRHEVHRGYESRVAITQVLVHGILAIRDETILYSSKYFDQSRTVMSIGCLHEFGDETRKYTISTHSLVANGTRTRSGSEVSIAKCFRASVCKEEHKLEIKAQRDIEVQ